MCLKKINIFIFIFLFINGRGQNTIIGGNQLFIEEKGKQETWIAYNKDSSIRAVFGMKDNELNGSFILYFPDTNMIEIKGHSYYGMNCDTLIRFWKQGQKRSILSLQTGIFENFDEQGTLIDRCRLDTLNGCFNKVNLLIYSLYDSIRCLFPQIDTIILMNNYTDKEIYIYANHWIIKKIIIKNDVVINEYYYQFKNKKYNSNDYQTYEQAMTEFPLPIKYIDRRKNGTLKKIYSFYIENENSTMYKIESYSKKEKLIHVRYDKKFMKEKNIKE